MNLKRVMPILAVVALATAQQTAPRPPSPEVRGVVLDSGTNQPVGDAQISVSARTPEPVRMNGGWKADDSQKLETDYRGAFTLRFAQVGEYRIEAQKDGYVAPGTSGLSTDGRTRENRGTASVAFSIVKENLEITAHLTLGVTVEGAFVPGQGAQPPDLAKLKISLSSVDRVGFLDEPMNVAADAEGSSALSTSALSATAYSCRGLGPAVT